MNSTENETNPKPKKSIGTRIKHFFIALIIIVIAFFAGVIVYFKAPVSSYYKASTKTFKIPDISKGFIPQGLSYDSASGDFYITGYNKDGSASPIYIVDKDTKKVRKTIKMATADGQEYDGHCGGLSVFNGKVYVAGSSDSCLYVYDPSTIRSTADGELLAYDYTIDLSSENDSLPVAFTAVHGGQLIAGEFYRAKSYPTSESHWIETSTGQTNRAIAVSMIIDGTTPIPTAVYSLPNQVQGMYMDDSYIYLSTSYAVAFSHILTYDQAKIQQTGTFNILGVDVPLYILDESNMVSDTKIAPMSEEIDVVDGQMYTMCESASDKYIFGKFTGAKRCYATDISLFTNPN